MYRNLSAVDKPINPKDENGGEDLLNVKSYINGLGDFILNCSTPMTIAIQGDWGTGKTSMMNMVSHYINKKESVQTIKEIHFNTWQYSQFHLAEELPISLLSSIISKVVSDTENQELKEMVTKAKKLGLRTLKLAMFFKTGSSMDDLEKDMDDVAECIQKLKKQFQDAVSQMIGKDKNGRLVIYIDDLDRLNPETAVEILEVIKVFLDVEGCIFVLAVDYGVVSQGVKKKYGDSLDDEKGKSFFDKIIQLPFKVPVSQFDLKDFLKKHTDADDFEDNIEDIERIIKSSIGSNPRTIKRVFNLYHLNKNIISYEKVGEDINSIERTVLFSVLCMNIAYEKLYEYFVETSEWKKNDNTSIFNMDSDNLIEKLSQINEDKEKNYTKKIINMAKFLTILKKVIFQSENSDKGLVPEIGSDLDFSDFEAMLSYSQITTKNEENTGNILNISLEDEKKIKEFEILGASYKAAEYKTRSFKGAYVWLLGKMCEDEGNLRVMKEIKENPTKYKLTERMFNIEKLDKKLKSSIKQIHNTDIKIVTHYSSEELCKQLNKFIIAFKIDEKDIRVFGHEKTGYMKK